MDWRIGALAFLVVQAALSSNAAVFTVTSLANAGPGTLRDLVAASAPGDEIQFGVQGTIVLNAAITIGKTLYVEGPGASKLIVSANNNDRVFVTGGNPVLLSGMTIRDGLVVGANGLNGTISQDGTDGADVFGGGILNQFNSDSLVLSNCWLANNRVQGGNGGRGGDNGPLITPGKGGRGGLADGGALYATGKVAVINCTFSDNRAIGGAGGAGGKNNNLSPVPGGTGGAGGLAWAGAVDVSRVDTPAFTNCTFSGNGTTGGNGGAGGDSDLSRPGGQGGDGGGGNCGAISFVGGFAVMSCTIVSNSAVGGNAGAGGVGVPAGSAGTTGAGSAGGICGYVVTCGGPEHMGNTILAENFASTTLSNGYAALNDLGFNFIGDDKYIPICGGGLFPPSRQGTVASPLHPELGPLAQNGAGLPTHAPQQGSPVIDTGYRFNTTTDERRAPRPYGSAVSGSGGDGSDVGAFEFGSTPLGLIKGNDGTNWVISWPACYGDFILQSATNLADPAGWSDLLDTPLVVGSEWVVTNSSINLGRFYRLRHRWP